MRGEVGGEDQRIFTNDENNLILSLTRREQTSSCFFGLIS